LPFPRRGDDGVRFVVTNCQLSINLAACIRVSTAAPRRAHQHGEAATAKEDHVREVSMRAWIMTTAFVALALATPAQSQSWPQRQVTIVVPFTAGGTTDMFARMLAQGLQQKYGSPFVVDNRAGAGGNVGAAAVARAAGDGYTLLVGTVSTHAINPFIY